MNKKFSIYLVLLFIPVAYASAQSRSVIDSLSGLLKTSKDTVLIDVYNQLSYEYRNSDIDLTLAYADTAITLSKKKNYVRGLGYAFINRGNYFKMTGDNATAKSCYTWAYVQHKKIGNKKGVASTLNSIASLQFLQGNLTTALSYFIKSLTISQEINDRRGEAITLNNIGVINLEQKNFSKALEYYERAYHTLKELNDENNMADALNNIGNVYHTQGINSEALKYYNQALEVNIRIGDIKDQSSVINNIGLINFESKNYKQALKYYHQSLGIDEKLNDKQGQAITCNNIANCYYNLSMFYAAKNYAERALAIASQQNDKIDMVSSYDILTKLEDELGNYKQALIYYKLYNAYSDSLYSEETRQKLEDIEEQYQAEKAENERLVKALEKDRLAGVQENPVAEEMKRNIQVVALVLVAFVVLIYLVFFIARRK